MRCNLSYLSTFKYTTVQTSCMGGIGIRPRNNSFYPCITIIMGWIWLVWGFPIIIRLQLNWTLIELLCENGLCNAFFWWNFYWEVSFQIRQEFQHNFEIMSAVWKVELWRMFVVFGYWHFYFFFNSLLLLCKVFWIWRCGLKWCRHKRHKIWLRR